MNKSNKYTSGVATVVSRAQAYNSRIGSYIEHFENENFQFSVRLTGNTAVTMSQEIAQDQEDNPSSVTPERIQGVANTFRVIG